MLQRVMGGLMLRPQHVGVRIHSKMSLPMNPEIAVDLVLIRLKNMRIHKADPSLRRPGSLKETNLLIFMCRIIHSRTWKIEAYLIVDALGTCLVIRITDEIK